MTGQLVGVGVGPGDPELITVKAERLLRRVGLVFYPSHGMARAIAARYLDPGRQELIPVPFPLQGGEEAARAVAERLVSVPEAAYLTEGDPLLYGSFLYLAEAVRRIAPGIAISVIPGVPAFAAAAAAVGMPLARGKERIALVTGGHGVEAALREYQLVVVLKAGVDLEGTLDALDQTGRAREAVLVTRCGLPEQEVVTDMGALRGRHLDYFSLLLVGRRWPA